MQEQYFSKKCWNFAISFELGHLFISREASFHGFSDNFGKN